MPRGKVKWFNDQKGYGFIEQDGGGPDLFVHFRFISQDGERGWRTLEEGAEVEFDIHDTAKGPQAHNVVVISQASVTGSRRSPREDDYDDEGPNPWRRC